MLLGNLTRDPEVRTTPNGQSVANFGIATNRNWTDQAGVKQSAVEYHNIVVWGKLADICGQYLHKGKKIYIEGRIQTRDWEGQDGVKRKTTEIVGDNMIMLGGRSDGQQASPASIAATPVAQGLGEPTIEPIVEQQKEVTQKPQGEEEVRVEDIPF